MAEKRNQPTGSTTPADPFADELDGRLKQAKQRSCLPAFNLLAVLLLFLSCGGGFALPFLEVNFNLRTDGDLVPRALMFAASSLGLFYVIIHICGSRTHFTITQHGPPWIYGNHLHTAALLLTRLGAAVWIAAIVMLSLLVARLGIRLGAPLVVQAVYLDLIVSGVAFLSLIAVIFCIELSKTPFKTSVLSRRSFLRGRPDPKSVSKNEDGELSVSRRASLVRAEKVAAVTQPKKTRKSFLRRQPDEDDQPRQLLSNDDDDEYDFVSGSSDRPLRSPVRQSLRASPEERTATPPSFMTSRPRSRSMVAGPRPASASAPRSMPQFQPDFIINPQTGRPVTYFDVRREPTLPVLLSPARPVTYFDVPKRPATSYMPYRPKASIEPASTFETSFRPTTSFDPLAEPTEKFEPAKKIERPTLSREAPVLARTVSAADRPRMPPPVAMTRYTLMPPPQRPVSAGIIKRKPVGGVQSRMSTGSAMQSVPAPTPMPMPELTYRGVEHTSTKGSDSRSTPSPNESSARPAAPGFLRSQNLAERAKARHAARSRSGSRSGSDGAAEAQRDGPSAPALPHPLYQNPPEPVQGFKTIPAPAWTQKPQNPRMSSIGRTPSPPRNTGSPFQDPGNPFDDPVGPSQPPPVPSRNASRQSVVSSAASSRPQTARTVSTRSGTTAPSTAATTLAVIPPPLKTRAPSPQLNSSTPPRRANTTSAMTHTRGLSRTQLRMRKENMNRAVHHRAASSVNNFSRPLRATESAVGEQSAETHNRSRSDAAESATSGSGGSMVVQRGDTPPIEESPSSRGRVIMTGSGIRGSRVEKRASRVVSSAERRSGPMSPMTIMMLKEKLR